MISRILVCLCSITVLAAMDTRADQPLFASHEVMNLTIPLDFKHLCRPREAPDCDYTATTLEYPDALGNIYSLPIEVKIRGGWRSLTKNCSAPLLFIRFDEHDTAGTVFEGQTLLPLTTHCGQGLSIEASRVRQRRSTWEQYLLKEYLAHLLYNEITPISLNARLVRMTYPNPDKPNRSIVNYAFFTEHFESAANRIDVELLTRGQFDPEKLDAETAGLLALFQFMIGNTDWSIASERNVVLLSESSGLQQPLPYDFDMSGLVNAHYAGPAPGLPIDEVVERYFLGFCHPDTDWGALIAFYLARRDTLLATISTVPGLDTKSTRATNQFLDDFFTTLGNKELTDEKIVNACQPWPPSSGDHDTPGEMR